MYSSVSQNVLAGYSQAHTVVKYHIVNIKLVVDSDQFEVIWNADNGSNAALERYRTMCCALCYHLKIIPPSRSDEITWTHIVDLFYNLHAFASNHIHDQDQSTTDDYIHKVINGATTTNVTVWFKNGALSPNAKAYIFSDLPWKAVIATPCLTSNESIQLNERPRFVKLASSPRNTLYQDTNEGRYPDQNVQAYLYSLQKTTERLNTLRRSIPTSPSIYGNSISSESSISDPSYVPLHTIEESSNTTQYITSHSLYRYSQSENTDAQDRSLSMFIPSRELQGKERVLNARQIYLATLAGIDLNIFKGDITTRRLVDRLTPDSENCALRILDIHSQSTLKEFFAAIRTGKVYHFHYLAPQKGKHNNCAANLAFFNRREAEAFKNQCDNQGVWIHGQKIKAIWNRDKCAPIATSRQSRVVIVFGPKNVRYIRDSDGTEQTDFMSVAGLEKFFRKGFYFTLVETKEWGIGGGKVAISFEFGSVRCQGEFAHMSLRRYLQTEKLSPAFSVAWGRDPCGGPQ